MNRHPGSQDNRNLIDERSSKGESIYTSRTAAEETIKDDRGKVVKWMGTNTDIHEKLQIQDELEQSRDRLRQISDTRRDYDQLNMTLKRCDAAD